MDFPITWQAESLSTEQTGLPGPAIPLNASCDLSKPPFF